MARRCILIVEDQSSLLLGLKRILQRQGYTVLTAENGKLGLELALEKQPDAILMDLEMPVMDGYEAARAVRADDRTRWVPIMATTSLDRPEDLLRALQAGFNRYLRKPLTDQYLAEQLEDLLLTAERRRKLSALSLSPGLLPVPTDVLQIDRDRQQLIMELLRVVNARVGCSLLAVAWGHDDDASLVLAFDGPHISEELTDSIEAAMWGDNEGRTGTRLIVTQRLGSDDGTSNESATQLDASWTMPFVSDDGGWGMLLVGAIHRSPFDLKEQEALRNVGTMVARAWQSTVLLAEEVLQVSHDLLGTEQTDEMEIVLALENIDSRHWAEQMEISVRGVRVIPAKDPDEMAAAGCEYPLLVLADEFCQDRFDDLSLDRVRAGKPRLPAMLADPAQFSDDPQRMAAYLLMSVVLGIVDGDKSGCLHLQLRSGGPAGHIVFDGGRVAWATYNRAPVSLMQLVAEASGTSTSDLLDAIRAAAKSGGSFLGAVTSAGLVTTEQYADALRNYITEVISELLKLKTPHLLWSTRVKVGAHQMTFDGSEILMSAMFGD